MTREPIEVTRQDRIFCLKASSNYHSEVCEECKFYPDCDHMTQDDMAELTIKDLESLEQEDAIEKIRAEVESINVWALRYAPTYDEDIRPQIVSNVKEHVLEIIDKYREDT